MPRIACLLWTCLVMLLPFAAISPSAASAQERPLFRPDVRVLESTASNLIFEITLLPPELGVLTENGQPCQQIAIDGMELLDTPQAPAVPVWSTLVAIPPGAEPIVEVLQVETEVEALSLDVCPALSPNVPLPLLPESDGEQALGYDREHIKDAKIYGADTLFPSTVVDMAEVGYLRDQRVARLLVYPVQYNPAHREIVYHTNIKLQVRFAQSSPGISIASPRPESDAFERILQLSLLNYGEARSWRTRPQSESSSANGLLGYLDGPSYKLSVQETGIYRLTYQYLQGLGLAVDTVDPRTFQLFSQGQEVALIVAGQQDGRFDPGDYLLFYGQQLVTKYTETNVYWLTYGQGIGLRVQSQDGSPGGTAPVPLAFLAVDHVEQDTMYIPGAPGIDELDRWLWNYVWAPSIPFRDYHFDLDNISTSPAAGTLDVAMLGAVTPNHHVRIYLNGHLVGDATWEGMQWHTSDLSMDQGFLLEGDNVVRVECPNDTGVGSDFVYVDEFWLAYWKIYQTSTNDLWFAPDRAGLLEYRVGGFSGPDVRVFSVTDPYAMVQITNPVVELVGGSYRVRFEDEAVGPYDEALYYALTPDRFLVPAAAVFDTPSDLRAASNGADYLIITHQDFYASVVPLAQYRQSLGLRSMVVLLEDLFDEFSFGNYDPNAIHDFLAYAYDEWVSPAPTYVLLVGDGHYDYKDNLNRGFPQYMPPYLAAVDMNNYETASDNRYVRFDGDPLPDMLIGRFPVNSAEAATVMVNKAIQYETSPSSANTTVAFVADNIPDLAGDFEAMSESLIGSFLSAPYVPDRVYLTDYCGPPTSPPAVCLPARTALANSINDGRLFVNWVGHSARYYWAHEQILRVNTLSALTNTQDLPIMLPMTCYEGQFHIPDLYNPDGLAESVVRKASGGAVASWSPTGKGLATGHHLLERGLFAAVFQDGVRDLGSATLLGKLYLWATGSSYEDLIHTYHLFGDPALQINALDADVSVQKTVSVPANPMPGDQVLYTLAFANAGPATAHGVILTDPLPAGLVDPAVVYQTPNVVGTLPGADYVWQIADLAPGETGEIQVQATIDPLREPPFSLVNTASIAMSEPDLAPANDTATVTTSVVHRRPTDLQITKAVQTPAEPQPGDTFTYTLALANAGPGAAHGVVVTDLIPALLLDPVVIYTSPEVIGQRPGAPFAWSIVDLPAGASGEIRFTAVAAAQPLASYWIENSAQITSRAPETAPANNVATVATEIRRPDLRLSKTVLRPGNPMPGDAITYTLSFVNNGAAVARDVQLVDWLPAELVTATVVYSSPEVISQHLGVPWSWGIVDLEPAAGGEVRIRAVISPTAAPPFAVVNQAAITSTLSDALPADNLASLSFGVMMPDLWVALDGPAAVEYGDLVTYTIAWGNHGSLAAPGARITDTLPPGMSYVSDNSGWPPEQPAAGVVAWSVTPQPVPTDTQGTFVLTASLSIPGEGREITPVVASTLVNQIEIAGDLPDGNPGDNASHWSTALLFPDLSVQKVGLPVIDRGALITYSISWANEAETRAPGVRITDTLPAGVDYVADDSGFFLTHPAPGVLVWQVAPDPILPGTAGSFVVTGQVSSTGDLSAVLLNRAAIGTAVGDGLPADNRARWYTTVLTPNLQIDVAGPLAATWGDLVTYTISWASDGAGSAPGVRITATLPAGVDYLSDDSGFPLTQLASGVLVWDVVPDLVPAGAVGTFHVTARVSLDPTIAWPLVHRVALSTAAPEADLADNQADWSTVVLLPDLAVSKSGPVQVVAGSVITYTLSFSNSGQGMALDVILTDPLPAGLTYLGNDSGLVHTQPYLGAHAWSVETLPPGTRYTFRMWAAVGDIETTGQVVTNTIVISSRTADADWSNHLSWWSTSVLTPTLVFDYYLPIILRSAQVPAQ
ncbi:MAG: DUF11 domain-containing protein [Anaerolineae bacterium]|nr:DUF11 domain-containing protein [Anaerolineae bacterium]